MTAYLYVVFCLFLAMSLAGGNEKPRGKVEHLLAPVQQARFVDSGCGSKGQGAKDYSAGVEYLLTHPSEMKKWQQIALDSDCIKPIGGRS